MKVQLICLFLVVATSVAVTLPQVDILSVLQGSQQNCNVCLYEFKQLLEGDKLQWLAKLVVPLMCSLTGLLQDKCLAFLNKYVDLAINMTIALGPEGCCERLGSCNKTSLLQAIVNPPPRNLQHRAAGQEAVRSGSDANCNVCKYEFTQILEKDKLQWIAKLVVPLACSITGPVAPKCEAFLDKYVDEFINMTISLGPEGICEDLGSCPKTAATTPAAAFQKIIKQKVNAEDGTTTTFSPNCAGCKMGAEYLSAFLQSRKALTEFQAIIDNEICKDNPVWEQICKSLTDSILPLVVSTLSTAIDPDTICASVCS